jgi:hypothetical protein
MKFVGILRISYCVLRTPVKRRDRFHGIRNTQYVCGFGMRKRLKSPQDEGGGHPE